MLTDVKIKKIQISKIIQSGGSLGSWLSTLDKITLINVAILLAKDNLPELINNLTSNAINKFERKISGKCKNRKRIYFIYFEWRYEWYY